MKPSFPSSRITHFRAYMNPLRVGKGYSVFKDPLDDILPDEIDEEEYSRRENWAEEVDRDKEPEKYVQPIKIKHFWESWDPK